MPSCIVKKEMIGSKQRTPTYCGVLLAYMCRDMQTHTHEIKLSWGHSGLHVQRHAMNCNLPLSGSRSQALMIVWAFSQHKENADSQ